MKKLAISLVFVLNLVVLNTAMAKVSKSQARNVINNFMQALFISDFNQSSKAVAKHVHKSLLNVGATDLSPMIKNYSFKKAYRGARLYQYPVKIVRSKKTALTAVGYDGTAEAGEVHVFYLKLKKGVEGMPAPVHVFFPEDGGDAKIINMGGL